MTPTGKTALCVTGMHRSGTSFAARVLELLGVDFGAPAQLMGPGPDNPAGYWENRFIKELDDEILAHLGGSWDRPPVLARGWELAASLDEFRTRAEAILDGAFSAQPPTPSRIAWKDPRLSLLLPFWRTIMPIQTTLVIVRHPLEVAASLERRNGIPPPHAALLWLRYVLAATGNDPGHLLLRHRDFFDDLPASMHRMAEHIGAPPPDGDALRAAESHLDPALYHHATPPPPDDPDPLTTIALLTWNDGDVTLDVVPPPIADAVAEGWLRSPVDTEALDLARAKVVELTERLRKRARARKAAAEGPS